MKVDSLGLHFTQEDWAELTSLRSENKQLKDGLQLLFEKGLQVEADLASRDDLIKRLVEDAEGLYYSIQYQEFGETEYQSKAVDLHRALMKELE